MATDYILFVHGVNTREVRETPEYAEDLIKNIKEIKASNSSWKRNIEFLPLYWGDVNKEAEDRLLGNLRNSPIWERVWFRTFREKQILQFAGDAALYISRYIGSKVVNKLKTKAQEFLQNAQAGDRLHLITHSWGTVILFDVLFATRWDNPDVPGHDDVMSIRDGIFGIAGTSDNTHQGIQLASIHTMGSPIAIFSLTDVVPGRDETGSNTSPSGHDITPKLQELLENIHKERNGEKLPWRNFLHPGDPIAYPLTELIASLVDGKKQYLDIQDVITYEAGIFDFLTEPVSQTALALLHGGEAHGSYWKSEQVAKQITDVLIKESQRETLLNRV